MSREQIDACIRASVADYFEHLAGAEPHAMHDLIMQAAERPLLDLVLQRAGGNQSKAAAWLGINRNTLHRKLLEHKLID